MNFIDAESKFIVPEKACPPFYEVEIIINEYISDGTFYKMGNKLIIGPDYYYMFLFMGEQNLSEKVDKAIQHAKSRIAKFIENYKIN